ncbi:UTP5 [[Candida] subhashii]|uniref:UTP5 n=1 Tax=[Candida] subhashii TaxID=561895 RepID=A0A8J5QKF9_9ASCO|nr:UTP5 [[Candida] subhashii]KAG7663778.1 UTP5 [[Candida] subhashii]
MTSTSGPILVSKFDPTNQYLASAQIALDTHQIKVQSISSTQSSLNTSFNLDKSSKVTNLTWIASSDNLQLLAICLTKGSVLIYSPQTNEIISELTTSYNVEITDFYIDPKARGWACDIEGNIFEWDLQSYSLVQSFKIGEYMETIESVMRISSIQYNNKLHLLLGTHSVYLFDIEDKVIVKTFPGHIQPINSIIGVGGDSFLTSAKGDRFINLYQVNKLSPKAVFVASTSVVDLAIGIKDDMSVLTIINEVGNLEIFNNPLSSAAPSTTTIGTPSKKKKKQQVASVSRQPNSIIKLSRPQEEIKSPQDSNMTITSISINDDSIWFSWLENSSLSFFDNLKWIDETGTTTLITNQTIHKPKPDFKSTSANRSTYGHDIASAKLYTEGHAIISHGATTSITEDSDEDEPEQESLAEKLNRLAVKQPQLPTTTKKQQLTDARSGISLSIILTQSIKNNDHSLLETVLSNRDPTIIKNTISRIDPHIAISLLDRISDKIARQQSRFDQLIYWLKWILVIHGSSIVGLSQGVGGSKLAGIHSILVKKGDTLPRLLELQGRLNMLYEQNDLKREILKLGDVEEDELDGESEVEYIEEIDDAKYNGEIEDDEDEDIDMGADGVDDFIDSDEEEEEEDDEDDEDDDDVPAAADLSADEEGNYSDLEIDG